MKVDGPLDVVSLTANHASRGGLYSVQCILTNITAPNQYAQCFFQTTQFVSNSGFHTIVLSNNSADVTGSALYGGNQFDMSQGNNA